MVECLELQLDLCLVANAAQDDRKIAEWMGCVPATTGGALQQAGGVLPVSPGACSEAA